jgi:hypothetical protein
MRNAATPKGLCSTQIRDLLRNALKLYGSIQMPPARGS